MQVIEALNYYGGEATLNDIYSYVKEHYGFDLPDDGYQSSLRKAIYQNSSDANLYQGKRDLFYTIEGKGSGIWGLRTYVPNETNIELTEDDEGFPEGKQKLRTHLMRERNPKVIREAKRRYKEKHGRLFCQVCGFDFVKVYGDIGEDYIEGHHTKPISEGDGENVTMIDDIALLCANCHKMVHRKRPWLTVDELQLLIVG
jgi:putative restriction endonuclease